MQLVIAIGFPWWLGYLVVRLLIGENKHQDVLIAIGYGYFIGCLFVFGACWIAGFFSRLNILYVLVFLLIVNILLTLFLHKKNKCQFETVNEQKSCQENNCATSTKIVLIVGLAWVVVRLVSLGAEIVLQPLYPWDAFTSWVPKARLWFLSNEILPIIDSWAWMGGNTVPEDGYVHGSAGERNYVSYIILWHSLARGYWDESLSQIPWLLAIVAFICAVSGQMRKLGLPKRLILCVILLYLSVPMLNSHIALPGYVDLWVSLFVALAVASLSHWNHQANHWQLFLAIAMIIGCYLVKSQSGAIWAWLLVAVLVVSYLNINVYKISLVLLSGVMLGLVLVLIGVDIGNPSGVQLVINTDLLKIPYLFNSETPGIDKIFNRSSVILKHLFWYDNWGLFWYMFLVFLIFYYRSILNKMPPPIILFVMSSLMIIFTYIFMVNYVSVSIETVVNRAFLHVVPTYIYVIAMLVSKMNVLNQETVVRNRIPENI